MRRFLVALVLLGAGAAFAQGSRYFPLECADEVPLTGSFVRHSDQKTLPGAVVALLSGYPAGGWSWECTTGPYEVDLGHVGAAVSAMSAYSDGRLAASHGTGAEGKTWSSERNTDTAWFEANGYQQVERITARESVSMCGYLEGNPANGARWAGRRLMDPYTYCFDTLEEFQAQNYVPVTTLDRALDYAPAWVSEGALRQKLGSAGVSQWQSPQWECVYEEPGACYSAPEPGDGGDPPGGGGPTQVDWGDDYSSRCARESQEHGLNVFQYALSWAFEPCEDWPAIYTGIVQAGSERAPFGFSSWLVQFGVGQETPASVFLWPCAGTVGVNGAGQFSCSQYVEILGYEVPPIDVREHPVMVWWHDVGRTWLWYVLLVGLVWMMWRGLMGS